MNTIAGSTLTRSLVSLFVITLIISVGSKDSYAQEKANIVGMWLFEDSGKVIVDSSGNGLDGKMVGGVKRTDDGKFSKGVWFDGKDGVIEIPDSDSLHLEAFTLMVWFKLEEATGGWQTIFGKQQGGAGHIIEVASGGFLNTGFGSSWLCTGHTVITDGKWHHAAFVFDGKVVQLYVDGSLDMETPAGTKPPENAMPLRMGGSPDIGEMFSGVIDEAAFFNIPLIDKDIQKLMSGLARLTSVEPAGKSAATWGSIKEQY
jgi:arabinan endo-1,5-alpha-L-arabinosidase